MKKINRCWAWLLIALLTAVESFDIVMAFRDNLYAGIALAALSALFTWHFIAAVLSDTEDSNGKL